MTKKKKEDILVEEQAQAVSGETVPAIQAEDGTQLASVEEQGAMTDMDALPLKVGAELLPEEEAPGEAKSQEDGLEDDMGATQGDDAVGLSDTDTELLEAAVRAAENGLGALPETGDEETIVVGIEQVEETGYVGERPNDTPAPVKQQTKRQKTANRLYDVADDVLTIVRGDAVAGEEEQAGYVWHAIQHAHRMRRMLTGTISGTRKTETGHTHVLVNYHGVTITIPDSEMGIHLSETTRGKFIEPHIRLNMIINRMLGAEVDFIVRGYDNGSRAVVASRVAAMEIKVKAFYYPLSEGTLPLIFPGRLAQARVVAVSEKAVRLEVFGVERTIPARLLSWEWVTDARELFAVGDEVIVKIKRVKAEDGDIVLEVSIRDATKNDVMERLETITIQDRYAGTITDVHKGVYFIRLDCGVNAVAHDCRDFRRPSRKDVVSFVAVRKDYEQGVVLGMISRIIRHNI